MKRSRLWMAVLVVTGFAFAVVSCSLLFPAYDPTQLDDTKTTVIYDKYNRPAITLHPQNIIPVSFDKIPANLRNAVVAVEDNRFYQHDGVDYRAIGRAIVTDLLHGSKDQGASTISQQLAKNVFLTQSKSWIRKVREIILATQLERRYSKDEILAMYLNRMYFGQNAYGVEAAAETYFGKPVSNLDLSECATLAGLLQAPSAYNPLTNPGLAKQRRNVVFDQMEKYGYISSGDKVRAEAEPIRTVNSHQGDVAYPFPYYLSYILDEASNKLGVSEKDILLGGYRIYTNLDPKVQQAMEWTYSQSSLFPGTSKSDPIVQSGAVVIDPHSGGIAGIIGARGPFVFRGFNHATDLARSPGSLIKPLIVYGPALEQGYNAFSPLYDGPLDINGYSPRDWDHQTRGEVTLRDALSQSYNIPAVWLLNKIGIETGKSFAIKAGIPLSNSDNSLAIALGSLHEGVSPLVIAQAYSAFDNGGAYFTAHAINKIESDDRHEAASFHVQSITLTTKKVAQEMTSLLQAVVTEGLGQTAKMNRPVAGKTGTTEYSAVPGTNNDLWFVGYTPELVGCVWIGYDRTDSSHYLTDGSSASALVFKTFMSRAFQDKPIKGFDSKQ